LIKQPARPPNCFGGMRDFNLEVLLPVIAVSVPDPITGCSEEECLAVVFGYRTSSLIKHFLISATHNIKASA
jgi:hypothetical protein